MSGFDKVPLTAKVQPTPFKVEIDAKEIQDFKQLLTLSKIGPVTYENQQQDRRFGMTRDYLVKAKKHWETDYDWRNCEDQLNSVPNFTIPVKSKDIDFTIHFLALFSSRPDAIPVAFFHGWPGSILEFLPMLKRIKSQYPDPASLPYHIIVPSLPGYAFSSSPPIDKEFGSEDMPPVMNELMKALGFESYVSQGGDLGSFIARSLAINNDECKAFHVNMNMVGPPDDVATLPLSDLEKASLGRGQEFMTSGSAYAMMHGQRTATIGLALSASPLALLSWIGEKFLEWSDQDPSLDEILDSVSLYWFTNTYARCIYPYRAMFSGKRDIDAYKPDSPTMYSTKPQGYSWFPKEIVTTPISWVAKTGNLVFSKQHDKGGHFAALERPDVLWSDVEEFIKLAWK